MCEEQIEALLNEMNNVRLLRDLEDAHGEEEGRAIFADLV